MSGDDEQHLHDGEAGQAENGARRRTRRSGKRRQRDDEDGEAPAVEVGAAVVEDAAHEDAAVEQEAEEHQEDAPAPRQRRQRREPRDADAEGAEGASAADENAPAPVFKLRRLRPDAPVEKDYTKLGLNPLVVQALQQMKFTELTDIQARCIPQALGGRDLLAEAKTGSGKTLAFLIPMLEVLNRAQFRARNGTGAICIGPTRELCQQIEGVLLKLTATFNGSVTFLCCIGGINRKQEGYKLAEGRMIVVATPGRLLDHLQFTKEWNTKGMLVLAVDEADRVLDNGFEQDVRDIVKLLPTKRQTFLFSATQTTRVEQLARVSLQGEPLFISLKTKETQATVETLEQGYVVCPSELRFLLLYQFIKKNKDKKIIVFFSSRNSVSFHCELLNYVDVPCVAFHGKQKQHQRSATFMQFGNAESGVLLTTDVAARGLDIPRVDWIVQFDPTDDATKYIHRVGRTARAGNVGRALMFLLPSELDFLKYLHADANVAVNEYVFDLTKITDKMREQMEKLVSGNYYLRTSARTAFEGYLLAYSASQLKKVFDVQSLDLARVAKGFGLSEPPPVRLDLSESAARLNKRSRKQQGQQRAAPAAAPGTTKTQWTR